MLRFISAVVFFLVCSFSLFGSDTVDFRSLYQQLASRNFHCLEGVDLEAIFIKAVKAKKLELANILLRQGLDLNRPVYDEDRKSWRYPKLVIQETKYTYLAKKHDKWVKQTVPFAEILDLQGAKKYRFEYPVKETTKGLLKAIEFEKHDAIKTWLDTERNGYKPLFTRLPSHKLPLFRNGLWLYPLDIAVILGSRKTVKYMLKNQRTPCLHATLYPFSLGKPAWLTARNLNLLLMSLDGNDERSEINQLFHDAYGVRPEIACYPSYLLETPLETVLSFFSHQKTTSIGYFSKYTSPLLKPCNTHLIRE